MQFDTDRIIDQFNRDVKTNRLSAGAAIDTTKWFGRYVPIKPARFNYRRLVKPVVVVATIVFAIGVTYIAIIQA